MKKFCSLAVAVGFAAALFSAPQAQAVPMSCTGGTGGGAATYTLTHSAATQCEGGNDTNTITSSYVLFGKTGWVLSDKNDSANGDGTINFTDAPVNGTQLGDWTIDTLAGLTEIVITLKAGNGFAAFLLDLTVADPLTGTWASTKNLSHSSIYYNGTPSTVPLPAGILLLLSGVGGLVLVGRRRKALA